VEQPVGASLDRSLTSRPETDDRADQEIDQFIARRHAQRRGSEDRGEAPWVESERRAQAARDARLRLEWSESTTTARQAAYEPTSTLSLHTTNSRPISIYRKEQHEDYCADKGRVRGQERRHPK
jgi:hypothetical protein